MSEKIKNQVKALLAKREQYVTRIKNAFDLITGLDDETQRKNFLVRYINLKETKENLEQLTDQINYLKLEIEPNYEPDYEILNHVEDMMCQIENAKQYLTLPEKCSQPGLKLPKLELARFSGNFQDWPIFYENFKKSIHDNPGLSSAEKMQYLIGKLSGRALNIVSGIPATADNYEIMWKSLIEKFEDKRKLASVYLSKMFNFRTITAESSHSLELFLEHFCTAFEALKQLNVGDLADFIVLHLASTKIDPETFREFEMSENIRQSEFPTFLELTQFIKKKIKILERVKRPSFSSGPTKQVKIHSNSHSFLTQKNSQPKCKICNDEIHPLFKCNNFLKMSPQERSNFIKREKRCVNCLSHLHRFPECKSESTCKICFQRHNTLLHDSQTAEKAPTTGVSLCSVAAEFGKSSVLLSTAVIRAIGQSGITRNIRVLLDSASQPNLITMQCVKSLGLKVEKFYSSAQGIGESFAKILGKVVLSFSPHFQSTPLYSLEFYVVSKIADRLPSAQIDVNQLPHLHNLILADKNFYIPGPIDAIIGAELYSEFLKSSKITDVQNSCFALDTSLGYVVMGKAPTINSMAEKNSFCFFQSEPLETLVSKFWALENFDTDEIMSEDDKKCEKIFVDTFRRDIQGRYMVDLPFKDSPSLLGNSWNLAERRFSSLEKRFLRDPNFKSKYVAEIRKLIDNDYIRSSQDKHGYFIPHHGVVKAESSSTPLRIVFDASAKTDSGVSLNDLLFVGPKLQANTFSVLLRFRLFSIAVIADVRQMYLRILMNPNHTKYQKLIWRFDSNEPLQIYELTRVVFGVKSSPYLALRTVQQLSSDEKDRFPLAAKHIPSDMYVDDLVASISDVENGVKLFEESVALFKSGGFELAKWATNNEKLLQHIPVESRGLSTPSFDQDAKFKVLGLIWDSQTDSFSFKFQPRPSNCTKRSILSTLARIFDPLGFLGPVLLYVKCLIKELWELKLGWDDHPPAEFKKHWEKFICQIPTLSQIVIPRHLMADNCASISIIGFCDGSKKGYGAVLYCKTMSRNGEVRVSLLTAKSRVSPLTKPITIPQCELNSAWLLSRLLRSVIDSVTSRIKIDEIWAFSDSTITLSRIKSSTLASEIFVRNRVTKIREDISPNCWHYISTKDNPADCLSKGLLPNDLVHHPLWWYGPSWLVKEKSDWPVSSISIENSDSSSEIPQYSLLVAQEENPLFTLSLRCSKWRKFLHAVVYVLRFCKKLDKHEEVLHPKNLEIAERFIFHKLQLKYFSDEINHLQKKQLCSRYIQKLQPFMDENLLRVGGRLKFSNLNFDQKHPILLPKSDHIVELLVKYYHLKFLHAGPQLLISLLRQKFWILSCRSLVRKIFHQCHQCFRAKPRSTMPQMADLPQSRVVSSTPFTHTGVDYAGPFFITLKRARGQRSQKAYLCLFICYSTKATHLELATDLSTPAFLNAFKRFLARRGQCKFLYSDQGKNFVGARGQLDEIFKFLNSDEFKTNLKTELNENRIVWKFNPPSGPHFGGLWEANIGAVKTHLKRVVGNQILSLDEFHTLLAQIEAILNSRPLTLLSEDPAEASPLTPAHFLVGKPLVCLPSGPVPDTAVNQLSRSQMLDAMTQHFWRRWSREFLHTLQSRQKWLHSTSNICPGTVVLLDTDNMPPLQWPLGVIEEVFPGADGTVRVAQVRTNKGSYRRPVAKLYPLPVKS